ncbi:MAG: hypothetical protein Q7J67_00740 [bacterium]|nr:hypothetical protein [bacterium]
MANVSAPFVSVGSAIVGVVEQVIVPVSWTAVSIPADKTCKELIISERSAISWRLSANSDGSTFFTVTGPLSMEIFGSAGQVLFYAQTTAISGGGSGLLEIMLVN